MSLMQNVTYANCRYAECHYAECRGALFFSKKFGENCYQNKRAGVGFKTLHFLCNLRMGPLSWSVTLH